MRFQSKCLFFLLGIQRLLSKHQNQPVGDRRAFQQPGPEPPPWATSRAVGSSTLQGPVPRKPCPSSCVVFEWVSPRGAQSKVLKEERKVQQTEVSRSVFCHHRYLCEAGMSLLRAGQFLSRCSHDRWYSSAESPSCPSVIRELGHDQKQGGPP